MKGKADLDVVNCNIKFARICRGTARRAPTEQTTRRILHRGEGEKESE